MNLILASNNKGKIEELKSLLRPFDIDVLSMAQIGYHDEIEETGITLHENAYLKAKTIFEKYNCPVLSDDSGLFVKALAGAPGVYSARYAGEHKSNPDNIAKILEELSTNEDREAYFACVLCFIFDGEPQYFEGRVYGNISTQPSGQGGFGYDPIFVPLNYSESFAELDASVKNKISHRAQAMKLLFESFTANEILQKA